MRLKTKLVLAITSLVLVVVVVFSWIWMSWLLQQHIEQSFTAIDTLAHQVANDVTRALDTGLKGRQFDPHDPAAVRQAVAETLRENPDVVYRLNSIVEYSPTVLDVSIADHNGRSLISAPDATQDDQVLPGRPDFASLRKQSLITTLRIVFGRPQVYNRCRTSN